MSSGDFGGQVEVYHTVTVKNNIKLTLIIPVTYSSAEIYSNKTYIYQNSHIRYGFESSKNDFEDIKM